MTTATPIPVSIVVSNHNYQRFVGSAIDSCLSQGPGVEVVVVDDGSTDDSSRILARYHNRVRLILQDNGGQGSALNAGLDAATGGLILLLDADDVLLDGAVERLRAAAADDPDAVMILHPMVIIDAEGRATGDTLPEAGRSLPEGDLRPRVLSGPDDIAWQPASGLAFRADVLRQVLPIPADEFQICADVYLLNTVALYGTVTALDRPGAGYRHHGANAHLRHRFDLDRLRATIRRSDLTHGEIERRSRALGLRSDDKALHLRSVTDHAGRLLALRLTPADSDAVSGGGRESAVGQEPNACSVGAQVRAGIEAAWRRPDIGVGRKLLMTGWFATAAVAPRRWLPRLASLALSR